VLLLLSLCIRSWKNTAVLIASLWVVSLLVFYLFVTPLEGLYDRFLWPAFAGLCVLGAIGLERFSERFSIRYRYSAALVVIAQVALSMLSPRTAQSLAAHEDIWDRSMEPIIRELQSFPHSDSLSLAYGDAGYVVYRSGVRHIDLFGLNDNGIAHARTPAAKQSIVLSERPDLMLLPIAFDSGGRYRWIEDGYGLAEYAPMQPIAFIKAYPYPLALVLDTESRFYRASAEYITSRVRDTSSSFQPLPFLTP
jgi:hypothetical protein